MDRIHILVAAEELHGRHLVEPGAPGDGAQHRRIADVVTIGEVGGEQGLGDFAGCGRTG